MLCTNKLYILFAVIIDIAIAEAMAGRSVWIIIGLGDPEWLSSNRLFCVDVRTLGLHTDAQYTPSMHEVLSLPKQ